VCLPARSNSDALPLTDDDVTQMKASDVVAAELITNYRIMLDFYGMVLVDARTGSVARSPAFKSRCDAV
jgi:hypothetical protein